jgi:uncharacterized protein YdcH (DUF465 family)
MSLKEMKTDIYYRHTHMLFDEINKLQTLIDVIEEGLDREIEEGIISLSKKKSAYLKGRVEMAEGLQRYIEAIKEE